LTATARAALAGTADFFPAARRNHRKHCNHRHHHGGSPFQIGRCTHTAPRHSLGTASLDFTASLKTTAALARQIPSGTEPPQVSVHPVMGYAYSA